MTRSKQQSTKKPSRKAGKKARPQSDASDAQTSGGQDTSAENYGTMGVSDRRRARSSAAPDEGEGETGRASSVSTSASASASHTAKQKQRAVSSCGGSESASSTATTATEAMLVPKFIKAQINDDELKEISQTKGRHVASFYEAQNDLISRFLGVNQNHTDVAFELQNEHRRLKQRQ
ncbi:hypothetical protein GGI11_008556, partial [Coemansia sp. RSA 2049]